jgi:hypothetical protein
VQHSWHCDRSAGLAAEHFDGVMAETLATQWSVAHVRDCLYDHSPTPQVQSVLSQALLAGSSSTCHESVDGVQHVAPNAVHPCRSGAPGRVGCGTTAI